MAEPKRASLQSCVVGGGGGSGGGVGGGEQQPSSSKTPTATVTSSNSSNHNNNNNNNNNSSISTSTGSKKKSEKKKKDKQIAPSIRFSLNLFESNDHKYPEFNYGDLLKNAERKRQREKKKNAEKSSANTNGNASGPFDETDEDEKVLDVARYFEEKYGNRKKSDYVDLGAGYDESDSFIDNTDMYDELVPQEVTTVHGGFYVNSGPLEFKDSDNVNELLKRHNLLRNDNNNDDEEDDDDESSDNDSEEEDEVTPTPVTKKNSTKRLSSDIEEIDISQPPKSKPRIAEEAEIVL